MKIDISSQEYRDLLDILHIADVVTSGHRKEPDARTERHRALIQKLYGFAEAGGFGQLITHDAINRFGPTALFEQTTLAHTLVDEFGDHLFWDELIGRLSMRDAAQITGGVEHLEAMNETDRQHVETPIRQRYSREFALNGLANLTVIERFRAGNEPVGTSD